MSITLEIVNQYGYTLNLSVPVLDNQDFFHSRDTFHTVAKDNRHILRKGSRSILEFQDQNNNIIPRVRLALLEGHQGRIVYPSVSELLISPESIHLFTAWNRIDRDTRENPDYVYRFHINSLTHTNIQGLTCFCRGGTVTMSDDYTFYHETYKTNELIHNRLRFSNAIYTIGQGNGAPSLQEYERQNYKVFSNETDNKILKILLDHF